MTRGWWRFTPLVLGDIAIFQLGLMLALFLRLGGDRVPLLLLKESTALFAPIFGVWLVTFFGLGLYDLRRMQKALYLMRNVLIASVVNWGLITGLFFVLGAQFNSRADLILTILMAHAGAVLWRQLWVRTLLARTLAQKVAFLGDSALIAETRDHIQRHRTLGYLPVDAENALPSALFEGTVPSAVEGEDYWPLLKEAPEPKLNELDVLVVDTAWLRRNRQEALAAIRWALQRKIAVFGSEAFFETVNARVWPHSIDAGTWLLQYGSLDSYYKVAKRTLDIMLAAPLLAITGIVTIFLFVFKLFGGKGSIFYSQLRLGELGKEFKIWKFRTMVEEAERSGPLWSIPEDDQRVTKVGRILRRFRLDELPQFWNVLKGEMSLVGPRPEWIEEIQVLQQSIRHYHLRHLVKPGITGWAQVNYRATNSLKDSVIKLSYDLFYVKNVSVVLDLCILIKTLQRIFARENQFEHATPIAAMPPAQMAELVAGPAPEIVENKSVQSATPNVLSNIMPAKEQVS
jgi:exopolysaccharide biosynthesis polyprenyl glycosylphosphotransferase